MRTVPARGAVGTILTRLRKLRKNPEQFFRDSRHAPLRFAGHAVVRLTRGRGRATDWLHEPEDALLRANLPLLTPLMRRALEHDAERRRALIASEGDPRISVVMAAHDAADTIAAALASLQQQRYGNLDIIVVDDASHDRTRDIADRLAADDPRIRVVHSPLQRGAAAARNLGLAACEGDYITFHDADDRAHPERLDRQLAALLGEPTAVVCVCNGVRVDRSGRPLRVNGRLDRKAVISMMFSRAVFERLGYFLELRISEDAEYLERIKLVYGAGAELRLYRTLYYARFAPDSLLFSDGTTRVTSGDDIIHQRSAEADANLATIRRRHERIARGDLDAYVDVDEDWETAHSD